MLAARVTWHGSAGAANRSCINSVNQRRIDGTTRASGAKGLPPRVVEGSDRSGKLVPGGLTLCCSISVATNDARRRVAAERVFDTPKQHQCLQSSCSDGFGRLVRIILHDCARLDVLLFVVRVCWREKNNNKKLKNKRSLDRLRTISLTKKGVRLLFACGFSFEHTRIILHHNGYHTTSRLASLRDFVFFTCSATFANPHVRKCRPRD